MQALREACAEVARRARQVRIEADAIPAYAHSLSLPGGPGRGAASASASAPALDGGRDPGAASARALAGEERERAAAFWLTLDAINFGSGWFPTLRKPGGRSGYHTIAAGLTARFDRDGPWSAAELAGIGAAEVAAAVGQDPQHELMALFAASLRDLGGRLLTGHGGAFAAAVDAAGGSAVALARRLGGWDCFADTSRYDELSIPFLKRAQIAAADLARAGVASLSDLDRLTMFADNLVPHVLRLDGVLRFDPALVERIDREELIAHGSREEVEIRACALHAVELIVAARPDACAAEVDQLLWNRGQQPRYKAAPRHRARCTAY